MHNTHNSQRTTYNTQHTTQNIQHTTHNTQNTTYNTRHTKHNTQPKTFNTRHTTHNIQHTTYNTRHTTHKIQLTTQNTQYTIQLTTHNTQYKHITPVCLRLTWLRLIKPNPQKKEVCWSSPHRDCFYFTPGQPWLFLKNGAWQFAFSVWFLGPRRDPCGLGGIQSPSFPVSASGQINLASQVRTVLCVHGSGAVYSTVCVPGPGSGSVYCVCNW